MRRPIPADAGEPQRTAMSPTPPRAYPRGRGGAERGKQVCAHVAGLSPRTRGSQLGVNLGAVLQGPIPADAGEPRSRPTPRARLRAYPRGRGGAASSASRPAAITGLSPRTRGSRLSPPIPPLCLGPIPADAGEPVICSHVCRSFRAYPRGRGGAPSADSAGRIGVGLSPRTRGSRRNSAILHAPEGLSPRTRGSRDDAVVPARPIGPIPADAGEPRRGSVGNHRQRAYPRGRGGAFGAMWQANRILGLSPRTRGSLHRRPGRRAMGGPIPADAGEPACRTGSDGPSRAYPRGRGGASRSAV